MVDPLTITSTILSVAKALFGLRSQLREAHRERRDRIAVYFETVSRTLAEVSATLREGQVPHGKCAEMATYARQLADTIGDEIGQDDVARLASDLEQAHEVEMLFAFNALPDRDDRLSKLDEASGVFMALAVSLRAAP